MGYTYRKYPEEFLTSVNGRPDKLYMVWYDMLKRCKSDSKDAKRYFQRGITVCKEWEYWPTFATWARNKGWAPGLEIDRENGDLGYTPNNCRFVTEQVQNENRDTAAFLISCKIAQRKLHERPIVCVETGKVFKTQAEAAEDLGILASSICSNLSGKYKSAGGFTWKYQHE